MNAHRFPAQVISFLLALTVIFAGSTLYYGIQSERAQTALWYGHEKAYSELLDSLSELDAALQKIQYTASPSTVSTLSAQIWRQSECAKSALSQLPSSEAGLEKTQTFIARTGDYAYSLLRSATRGPAVTAQQKDPLASHCQTAQNLTDELSLLKARLDSGALAYAAQSGGSAALADSFHTVEQEFPEYATLVYDGPFSEHLDKQSPKMLEGQSAVTETQARTAAARFCGLPEDSLSLSYQGGDRIACYSFSTPAGVSADVTVLGGLVYSMSDPRTVGPAALTDEQAVERAAVFLQEHGFESMKESYYTRFENMLTISFCAVQDGVTLYPDLVKVTVALDNGGVIGFEARGYLMSHHTRTLPEPEVSEEEARALVDGSLTVLSSGLAVIPTSGQYELLCREFICQTPDGMHVIVYINAETGVEENLLMLLESENGTLAL